MFIERQTRLTGVPDVRRRVSMPTVDLEDLESLNKCVGREIGVTGGSASRKSGSSNSPKRRKTASGFILGSVELTDDRRRAIGTAIVTYMLVDGPVTAPDAVFPFSKGGI